jgi:hypothetical protein
MRISDPPRRKRFRLWLRVVLLAVGILAAFASSILVQEREYQLAAIPICLVLLASLAEFVLADILTESLYPARTAAILEKLEANLLTYHDRIRKSIDGAIQSLRACDTTRVSGTLHLKVELYSSSGDESELALVQVTEYSGRLGGKRWRFTSASKGLIGRCLRTGEPEWVNFATEAEYEDRMVREFGYPPAEIAKHTKEARSYWAQPVYSNRQMIGVIFLFSTEAQVFPLAVNPEALQSKADEIAAYLEGAGIIS